MLIDVIGLGGRIGRMQYFLRSLLSAFVMAVATFFFAFTASSKSPVGLFLMVIVVVGLPFLWFTLMIHVKRIRDIGWPPLYVVLGWIAVNVIDAILVTIVPALAIAGSNESWLASTVNLGLVACLLFWPGSPDGDDSPHLFDTPYRAPTRQQSAAKPLRPPAQPARPTMPPTPTGFGRRGIS